MLYLIQAIGIVGAVIAFIGYLQKKHMRIVICRALCDSCFTVHWLLQSAWVGAAMGVVCIIKDFTLVFAVEKNRHVKLFTLLICILYAAMGSVSIVFGSDGIAIGILLIVANMNGTVAFGIKNEIVMRLISLPTEIVWLIYNSIAVSFGGILCQSFIIVSIMIALISYRINQHRKREVVMIPNNTDSKPRYSWRGVMIDCCRHFFSVAELKRIIEQMSILKLNKFHWHLSNDQGYRIESKVFPQLNEISSYRKLHELDPLVTSGKNKAGDIYGGFYTFDEIRDIVDYAKTRGIDVIPEIEMPGHTAAIAAAYPYLTCDGEVQDVASAFGVYEHIFCAGDEKVYEFIEKLLCEVAPLFPCEYFHIGGDEAPKSEWKKCAECNAVMKDRGLTNYEQLQVYFANRVIAILKKLGKTSIVWNDSVAESGLDESAVVQYWMEMASGESYVPKEFASGRKFIFSNQCQFYCDYSYAETPLRATLGFEPNVKGVPVPKENVLGIEAPMWTEWTAENSDLEKMLYPRLLAVAECGWNACRDADDFMRRAREFLSKPELNVLTPMPWEEATIDGEKALYAIAENMLSLSARHAKMAESRGAAVTAVTPDNAPKEDPAVAVYNYMKAKMEAAYTENDIRRVLRIISDLRART